jgi:multiple sugar transport system ATP-binding protein
MNFLPATLRRSGGAATVEFSDGTRLLAPTAINHGSEGRDGQPVIFGTRPEHLTLGDGGTVGTSIATEVKVVEPTGADTFVACRHGTRELSVVFRDRHAFAPGSTIHLQPDIDRAHLFDAASGRRLAA